MGSNAQHDFFFNATSVAHLTTCNLTNNTPAMVCNGKVSTTKTGPAAYLLKFSALYQHNYYHKPETHFISGFRNLMADDFIRKRNLTNDELLTYFILNIHSPSRGKFAT